MAKMRRTLGILLNGPDKRQVLDAYPYRMTHESVDQYPETVRVMKSFCLTLISDEEWLSSTTFVVRKDGRIPNQPHRVIHDLTKFRKEIV